MTQIFSSCTLEGDSVCVCVRAPPPDPATHPVDEDVSWQGGGGLLQAAEAVHHLGAVKGQRDLWQAASCNRRTRDCVSSSHVSLNVHVLYRGRVKRNNNKW